MKKILKSNKFNKLFEIYKIVCYTLKVYKEDNMNIKSYLEEKLRNVFKSLGYSENMVAVAFSDREGVDLQCNSAFSLAKEVKGNPVAIAENIVSACADLEKEFAVELARPAFINFKIKPEFYSKIANDMLKSDRLGAEKLANPITMVLDYGGANVAKPLHVGHMRSAVIGEALKRLNLFMGNNVIADVHLGDWGLQMGLTIAELMDEYDLGYYFGENKPKIEITENMLDDAYPKASARKKEDEEFAKRASDITLWLQTKKKGYYEIYLEIRKASVAMVKRTYTTLGTSFDLWNGESSVNDIVPEVLDIFKKKNLSYESEGAQIVDVAEESDNEPMPPLLLMKSNGAQMYPITEIATIYERVQKYNPDKILYLTDFRQGLHFKQVFRCVRKAGIVKDDISLVHMPFGTVNGKDGKPFKTRDGGAFKLENLIELVTDKAYEKLEASEKIEKPSRELALKIGLSALIYGDLSNFVSKDYIFDIDKFLTFEGKTGPYIQYSAVRIKSLLDKSDIKDSKIIIGKPVEEKIVMNILKLINSFNIALEENSLNSICLALYELASAYSNFYNDVKILKEENDEQRQSYLNLSKLVLKAIELTCQILAIEIPDRM